MLIILHVVLAVLSLAIATYNFFAPIKKLLAVSYGLASGTLLSGVLLIVFNNASVVRTCLSGIAFFAIVSVLNELARTKLPSTPQESSL